MIIEQNETTVAYRCPACGGGVMSIVGAFRLGADRLKLKCPCGQSEMTLTRSHDGQTIRVEVPCLVCASSHNFNVSASLFFTERLFLLPCTVTSLDICFIGQQKDVARALEESGKELEKLLEDAGVAGFGALHDDKPLPDAQLFDVVNFLVRDLECEGKVHCPCEVGPYDVGFTAEGDAIRVVCESCGAEKIFSSESISAASDFLHTDEIVLLPPRS